jgi:TPR repeat protein
MILDKKEAELKLLSKIFQTEGDVYSWEEHFQKVKQLVEQELVGLMDETTYPEKATIIKELNLFLGQLQLLLRYPSLKGKTIVGVMHDSSTSRKHFYETVIQPTAEIELILKNRNIPVVHINSDEDRIYVYNAHQKREEVDRKALNVLLNELDSHYKMDLRQVITHFLSEKSLDFNNLAFIDFSLVTNHEDSYLNFIEKTGLFLINMDYKNGWEKPLRYLSNIGYKKEVLIHVSEAKEELTSFLKQTKLNYKIVSNQLLKRLDSFDLPVNHAPFIKKIDQIIYEVFAYIYQQRAIGYSRMEKVNKSILLLEAKDKNGLIDIRFQVQSDIDRDSKAVEGLEKILSKIKEVLADLVDEFTIKDETIRMSAHHSEILYQLGKSYIKLEKQAEARLIATTLIDEEYKKGHLLLLSLDEKQGKPLNKVSLEALHSMTNSDRDVISSKIIYRKNLGFSDMQAVNLCSKLGRTDDPEILFLLGQFYAKKNSPEAIKYYQYALEKGNSKAGDELYQLYENKQNLTVQNLIYLGNLLNVKANFKLGMTYLAQNNEKGAIIHFSLAAIYEHSASILQLAEIFYKRKDYNRASEYYQAFRKLGGTGNQQITQRLGTSYYLKKDYQNAFETLKNCPTGDAYFMVGQIFENGLGKIANESKALPYYEKGKQLGHQKCASHYIKISTRLAEEKKKKEQASTQSYSSNNSYQKSTSSSYSSSSSSGCFLTTATCTALGKKDDCEEILAFKEFRDQWLIVQNDGPSMIEEYYRLAPSLVDKINSRPNPVAIYQYIWDKYMQKGYRYLLEKNYKNAKETYIEMVLEVEREYS